MFFNAINLSTFKSDFSITFKVFLYMSNLVHINKVEFARIAEVLSMQLVSHASCRFKSFVNFKPICIEGLASVRIEDASENNQIVYTTSLSFRTKDKTPMAERKLAFRLTSVNGAQFIIGLPYRPYPIIKENNPYPDKPGDDTLKTVQVTWKSLHPMLFLVV